MSHEHRLLIVEDSATQAGMLQGILADAGYDAAVAPSGEDAVGMLGNGETFSLVLSDIVMPGIDGFELCRRIKEDPETATLPVLLLTSLRDPLDVVRALEVGADYFLHKPYDAEKLLSRVRMTLSNLERRTGVRSRMALELTFLGREFTIDAERQQLLDLLVTTFEDLVETNQRLRTNEEELTQAQENLAVQLRAADLEHRHLATLLDSMPDAVFVTGPNGRITQGNRAAAELTGQDLRHLHGQRLGDVVPLVDRAGQPLDAAANPLCRPDALDEEHHGLRAVVRGQRLPVSVRTAVVRDKRGQAVATMAVLRDVSAETFADPETGLPSRVLFLDRLERAVLQSHRSGESVGLVFLTVERLGVVADTYGVEARGQLLAQAAQRLLGEVGDADTLAVAGEGELVLLCETAQDAAQVLRLADRLAEVLAEPFILAKGSVAVRAHAGVALGAGPGLDGLALLQEATAGAHQAADQGERSRLFDPELHRRVIEELELETDLSRAVERGELVMHYQPEIRMAGGEVVGTEALVRWHHPERGLLPPGAFIGLAEETGLILPIGTWILRQACHQAAAWNRVRTQDEEPLFVAVNLSARQFDHGDLVETVASCLADADLPPAALMLEITETAVMADPSAAADQLRALKALGVRLALDDFGTGHSSLAYLRTFPLDVLKIDMSFVHELSNGSDTGRAIVRAIISLGEAYGLTVLAEGVESEEQQAVLRELGCPLAAGYLFDRPMAPEELTAILQR